jgi:hypothetical protein
LPGARYEAGSLERIRKAFDGATMTVRLPR